MLRLTTLILEITGRLEKCFGQEASLLRAAVLDKWVFSFDPYFRIHGVVVLNSLLKTPASINLAMRLLKMNDRILRIDYKKQSISFLILRKWIGKPENRLSFSRNY